MAGTNQHWQVGRHGALEQLEEGLLTIAGEIAMPLGRFPRRMTVVGLAGGRTAIWSAIPLREPEMARIEALGAPAFLIVPGIAHRLDIKPWKARYPRAIVLCPPGARDKVEEVVPVDSTAGDFEDSSVEMQIVPGVGGREAALVVRRQATTLVVNDVLANVRHPDGIGAQIMARAFGFGVRRPRMPRVAARMLVEDKAALAAGFRGWASEPRLARIVVSHGDVIADRPAALLERIAADLEG